MISPEDITWACQGLAGLGFRESWEESLVCRDTFCFSAFTALPFLAISDLGLSSDVMCSRESPCHVF